MDIHRRGKLFFICGKMAAGKSTLSKELAAREDAVYLAQDGLLGALYPGEFVDLAAFVKYSTRLQSVLTPHIIALLTKGGFGHPRLSRQHEEAASLVSAVDRNVGVRPRASLHRGI
jgi:hypothetical protein